MLLSRILKYHLIHLLAIICFSCKDRDVVKEARGFWVHSDTVRGTYYSLTVKDSVVDVNSFGIQPFQLRISPLRDSIDARWPFDSWELAFHLIMRNDTLIKIYDSWETKKLEKMKYVRGDSIAQFSKLLFGDGDLIIRLVPAEVDSIHGEPLVVRRKSWVTPMFIGPPRDITRKYFPGVSLDSIAVQVDDVLISFSEFGEWLNRQQDLFPESGRDSIIVQLNVDRQVPGPFLRRVRETIRKSHPLLKVCVATVNWRTRKLILKTLL